MSVTISTKVLQDLVTNATKGASRNKMIPLTSLARLSVNDSKIRIITTDATNYLYVSSDYSGTASLDVVIPVDVFAKLVARTTSDEIELSVENGVLAVVGNGKYSIPLPVDENGQFISYPDPVAELKEDSLINTTLLTSEIISRILNTARPSLAPPIDYSCYCGYYVGDVIVATDTYKICGLTYDVLEEPMLFSAEFVDLFEVIGADGAEVTIYPDNKVVIESAGTVIYGTAPDDLIDYQIDEIKSLLFDDFDSRCVVDKQSLLNLLNRLTLFVEPYDNNTVKLEFTPSGVYVVSMTGSGEELLQYKQSEKHQDFTATVNVEMLQSQVKAYPGESIELWYGKENSIKFVSDNVIQVIALNEEN